MKTVVIIRHAKSSWDIATMSDFDRPLNHRGKTDAPLMAKKLLSKAGDIDAFISSPAKRAKETAELFAEVFDKRKKEIIFHEELYHASAQTIYSVIKKTDNTFKSIAVFTHNPGITEFVNTLTNIKTDNMPTCGVFAVKAPIDRWETFDNVSREFLFFDYPKLL